MKTEVRQLEVTTWTNHWVLRLAWAITDLAGGTEITQMHLAEALQYRPKVDAM